MNRAWLRKSNVFIDTERQSHKKQVRSRTGTHKCHLMKEEFWEYQTNHIFLVVIWSLDQQGKTARRVEVFEGPLFECELDLIKKIIPINPSRAEDLTSKGYRGIREF